MSGKEPGWSAKGKLAPLWQDYPGKRDSLAKAVGTTGSALSSRNSGARPLGYDLGQRLADALGVTLMDLGAPAEAVRMETDRRVVDHLEELAVQVAHLTERAAKNAREIARLRTRVQLLEDLEKQREDAATGR